MNYFRNLLARRTEDGASAVEYGLLVAAIAARILGVLLLIHNAKGAGRFDAAGPLSRAARPPIGFGCVGPSC